MKVAQTITFALKSHGHIHHATILGCIVLFGIILAKMSARPCAKDTNPGYVHAVPCFNVAQQISLSCCATDPKRRAQSSAMQQQHLSTAMMIDI
jgi:hypothetical protein